MPRDRLTFRQRDVTAAMRAIDAAGKSVARIEIHKDRIIVIPGDPKAEIETARKPDLVHERVEHAKQRLSKSKILPRA